MSLHVVRNGILTVVLCVLQVLFILGLVPTWSAETPCWYARRVVVAADVEVHAACDMVSFGGSARSVFADKGSSSLVSAARVPPDTIGTP